uniref:Uncharacterized protein n=1 Tax=Arion vulgaris TaxID=1028688 RepID=A0A0B7C417_9EUPU
MLVEMIITGRYVSVCYIWRMINFTVQCVLCMYDMVFVIRLGSKRGRCDVDYIPCPHGPGPTR